MISDIILKPKGPYSLKKLADITNDRIIGDSKLIINRISAIENAESKSITFLDNKKYLNKLNCTKASVCIISEGVLDKLSKKLNLSFLVSKNPYLTYIKLLNIFYPHVNNIKHTEKLKIKISESSYVSKKADFKSNIIIGDNSIVNSFSSIGPNVYIGTNCYIGNNVSISNAYIGNNVNIQDGTIIGQDGFGFFF